MELPADFDAASYLQLNPDVMAAGVDPAEHYLAYGRQEGRLYRRDQRADPAICGSPTERDSRLHRNTQEARSTLARHENLWSWIASVANREGFRVLELGSRAVISDSLWKQTIPACDYTGFDVLPGKNVDVVGDAHRLGEYFPPGSFDLVLSMAVFEHLAMPWIVAEEIARVLAPGGYLAVETHCSYAVHEMPWHFFQFSGEGLKALFCRELGFDVIDAGVDTPIVGRFAHDSAAYLRGQPVPDLYCHSSIIAQKTGEPMLERDGHFDWRRVAGRIGEESMYPAPGE